MSGKFSKARDRQGDITNKIKNHTKTHHPPTKYPPYPEVITSISHNTKLEKDLVRISIRGIQKLALVDTGASISCISQQIVTQ